MPPLKTVLGAVCKVGLPTHPLMSIQHRSDFYAKKKQNTGPEFYARAIKMQQLCRKCFILKSENSFGSKFEVRFRFLSIREKGKNL